MKNLKTLKVYSLLLIAGNLFVSTFSLHGQGYPLNKKVFIANMHVHTWSHHNGAEVVPSMQWHVWQADSSVVDINWLTEHNVTFARNTATFFTFQNGYLDTATYDIRGISADSHRPQSWKCLSKNGNCTTYVNKDTLLFSQSNVGGSVLKDFRYASRNSALAKVQSILFSKMMARKPICSMYVKPQFPKKLNDGKLKFYIYLTYHLRSKITQDIIEYNFVPDTIAFSRYLKSEDTVVVNIPVPSTGGNITLNLFDDVSLLQDGVDNTISDLEFVLQSRNKDSVALQIANMSIYNARTSADTCVDIFRQFSNQYNMKYNKQTTFVGIEYSEGVNHFNGFYPQTYTGTQLIHTQNLYTNIEWIDASHANKGLVSLNHPFGTNWLADNDSIQDYRLDTLATFYMNQNVFTADIMEVGYKQRGGGDMAHHLKLWDILTANRYFLYGNGVNDTHGNYDLTGSDRMQTYIWASDSLPTTLISALSKGRMYAGNYKFSAGRFFYSIGQAKMGDRTYAIQTNISPKISYDSIPKNSIIKLTQALLKPGLQLEYLHDNVVFNPANPIKLDLTKPCFVRISIFDNLGNAIVIGQPIVFLQYRGLRPSLDSIAEEQEFAILPNPAKDNVTFKFKVTKDDWYKIEIFDELGQKVIDIKNRYYYEGDYCENANISHLKTGNYFVKIKTSSEEKALKFIKQ